MDNKGGVLAGLVLAAALALVGAGLLAVWLIGSEVLRILALVAVGAAALAGVIAAAALPIRAWRKNDAAPIERQVIRETRIIDSRPPVAQLPPTTAQPLGIFPELLRGAYRAGLLAQPGEVIDADAVKRLPAPSDGWNGDITT